MFKKFLSLRGNSADRHVSTNQTYRVCGHLFSLIVFLLGFFSFSTITLAEEFSGGSAAELAIETNLLRGPQEDAEVVGRLPKGTILTLLGSTAGKWVKIEVELVNGVEQGWVDEGAIKANGDDEKKSDEEAKKKSQKKLKGGKRRRIPEDEMAVLRRDSSFKYGIYGGANYGILSPGYDESLLFQGLGLQGGGFVSFFLEPDMTLGVELGVTQLSGGESAGSSSKSSSGMARLLDISAVYEYIYRAFRFFGTAQYSLGMGIDGFPVDKVPSASDFSGLWIKVGAGYAFELSPVLNLVLKGFYGFSINRVYVGFQDFGVSAYLEFRG